MVSRNFAASVLRVIVFGSVVFAHGTPSRAGLATGLGAYYDLDGSGVDSSGNGLDLTLTGGVGFASGLYGQALDLHDNPSQYAVRSGDDSAFNFGANNFTIQVWVNFNTFGGREQTLLEKFSGSDGAGWTLTTPGGSLDFAVPGGPGVGTGPMSISTGVWHQIVVDRNGSSENLFLDGQVVATNANAVGAIPSSPNPLLIGRRDVQDGRDFSVDGRMDEIAVWNRALSDAEVTSLWNHGGGQLINTVPEPTGLTLLAMGGLTAIALTRRRFR